MVAYNAVRRKSAMFLVSSSIQHSQDYHSKKKAEKITMKMIKGNHSTRMTIQHYIDIATLVNMHKDKPSAKIYGITFQTIWKAEQPN